MAWQQPFSQASQTPGETSEAAANSTARQRRGTTDPEKLRHTGLVRVALPVMLKTLQLNPATDVSIERPGAS